MSLNEYKKIMKIDNEERKFYLNKPIDELLLSSAGYYLKLGVIYNLKK